MSDPADVNQLQRSIDLYEDLANTQPASMYRIRVSPVKSDSDGSWRNASAAPYVFEFMNTRFCEMLGMSRSEIEKNPGVILDFVHEEDKDSFAAQNRKANRDGQTFRWEGRMVLRGQTRWVRFESIPRHLESGEIIWTGCLYDITDQRASADRIKRQNAMLDGLNKQKDRFFGIIAHDLKAPLYSVSGLSFHLLEAAQKGDMAGVSRLAQIIHDSSRLASSLVSNLTDWALAEAGQMKCEPERFDLVPLIDEVLDLKKAMIESKSVRVRREHSKQVMVTADRAILATILRNLTSNAIKFTDSDGTVTIRASSTPEALKVEVTDSGTGIPEEALGNLFDVDRDYSRPGTKGESGTGLGLILCKELVGRHQGHLTVESEEGLGSTFRVVLPPQLITAPEPRTEEALDPPWGPDPGFVSAG